MTHGTTDSRRRLWLLPLSVIIVCLLVLVGLIGLWKAINLRSPSEPDLSLEAEKALTLRHGLEIGLVIEHFEANWSTLESHINPSIQSELATSPHLDIFGNARFGDAIYKEPFWLVTPSATVTSVRVLEYTEERFRAIACVTRLIDKTDTDGVILESLPPYTTQGVYVFEKEDNRWKLAAFFNTTDPELAMRDWYHTRDRLKQALGNLPEIVNKSCQINP